MTHPAAAAALALALSAAVAAEPASDRYAWSGRYDGTIARAARHEGLDPRLLSLPPARWPPRSRAYARLVLRVWASPGSALALPPGALVPAQR